MAGPNARRRRPGRARKLRILRSDDDWSAFWRRLQRGHPATRHLKRPDPSPGSWWARTFPREEPGPRGAVGGSP